MANQARRNSWITTAEVHRTIASIAFVAPVQNLAAIGSAAVEAITNTCQSLSVCIFLLLITNPANSWKQLFSLAILLLLTATGTRVVA
jgi:ABC-type polysaccharide/polyol phosphate export permease